MVELSRRGLFTGLSGIIALAAAPSIVRAQSIMPINPWLGLDLPDQVAFIEWLPGGHEGLQDIAATARWNNLPGGVGPVTTRAMDFELRKHEVRALRMASEINKRLVKFMGIPVVDGKTAYRAGLIFPKEKHYDPHSIHTFQREISYPGYGSHTVNALAGPIGQTLGVAVSSAANAGRDLTEPSVAEGDRGADASTPASALPRVVL